MPASELLAEVPDLADHEARRLLQLAVARDAAWMIGDPVVARTTVDAFRELVDRRRAGEPLQYIEGSVQFGPLQLIVDSRALIPRPETERLWEIAVAETEQSPGIIVDLCTGSGNLALACKHIFPDGRVIGVDLSAPALDLARANAAQLGLDVEFFEGDLFEALPHTVRGKVDLLISNPPYIASRDAAALPREIADHEPMTALIAGPIGTEMLARIAREAGEWLRPNGMIACEIGESHADSCLDLFAVYSPRIECDLAGRPRYVLGRAPQRADVH